MNKYTIEKVVTSVLLGIYTSSLAYAHEDLGETTVIATKFERELADVSSSVAYIDVDEVLNEGTSFLQNAIGYRIPGVNSTSLVGEKGQISSLFIRGTKTNQSQVLIDGVRASDSNFGTGFLLNSLYITPHSSVEILKGANSAIYGGEATGGVLSIRSLRGEGEASSESYIETGSFDSVLGRFSAQGDTEGFAYNFSVVGETTSNDRANSDYTNYHYSLRLDYDINDIHTIGFTYRANDSEYETPQSFGPFDFATLTSPVVTSASKLDQTWTTLFLESKWTESWDSRLVIGYQESDWDEIDALDDSAYTDSQRVVLSWDNQVFWNDTNTTVAGVFYENTSYATHFLAETDRELFGVHVNHSYKLTDDFLLSGGLRWEDHDDFGDETTWNAGFVWDVGQSYKVKGNVGKSFRTPTFAELNGIPSFFTPANPDLEAESSIAWDVSLSKDWEFFSLEATWFEMDIENSIGFSPADFSAINTPGKTKSNGLEFAAHWQNSSQNLDGFVSYTYQQNDALVAGESNSGPQQVIAAGVDYIINEKWNVGLTSQWVDQRSYGGIDQDSYVVVNPYINYKVTENVALHLRVDNAFDEDYNLVDFSNLGDFVYSARGAGVFAGVNVTW